MRLTLFSAADIAAALPMSECVGVMQRAFADFSSGRARVPPRTVIAINADADDDSSLLVKPAYLPGTGLGAKLVSFFPGNAAKERPVTQGVVVLMSLATGEPVALLDGTFLTAWRTGAATGAATDLLASPNVAIGALFGAGAQGRTQVQALDTVRDLEEIRIYSRTRESIETFIEEVQPKIRARLVAAESPSAAVADADVLCAATTSSAPVFDGLHVKEGAHVNSIGSFTPAMREIDIETVLRSRVFVDSVASVSAEPGDMIEAISAGVTTSEEWTELGAVVEGEAPGRRPDDDLTLFKSVGLAVQDVAAGAVVIERAEEMGLGTVVEF